MDSWFSIMRWRHLSRPGRGPKSSVARHSPSCGLPHALVAATFGGTADPVAIALKQAGMESSFFWNVTACIALTLVAAIKVKDPSKNSTFEADQQPTEAKKANAEAELVASTRNVS